MVKRLVCYCVMVVSLMSCSAMAEEVIELDYRTSSVTITKSDARGCVLPDVNSSCRNMDWSGRYRILKESSDKQWIQVEVLHTGNFWVNRKDAALFEDFKPYTAELPIKSIEYLHLTDIYEFIFLLDGNVKVIDGEGEWMGKMFYAPDLLEVRYPAPELNFSHYFGFKDGKVKLLDCIEGKDVPCKITYKKPKN